MAEETEEEKALRENIKKAIKRNNASYLNGVLKVELVRKNEKRIKWLKEKLAEIAERKKIEKGG